MNVSLEDVVAIVTIVSFGAAVVNYVVIKPLKISIDTLTIAVNKLETLLHKVEEDERNLDKRVSINEQKIADLQEITEELSNYHKAPIGFHAVKGE